MKIKFLILLIIPVLFINCGKDDDAGAVYEGVWIGTVANTDCPSDEDDFSNDLVCDENTCYKLSLNSDGSFSFQEGLPTTSGTWSISGSTLSLITDEEGEQVIVKYDTTLGDNLTLSLTSESTGCTETITFVKEASE